MFMDKEVKEVKIDDRYRNSHKDEVYTFWYYCPECGHNCITREYIYCPKCGVRLIWRDEEMTGSH